MTSTALVILDDASGQVKFGGGDWTLSTIVQWYLGTSYYPAFADGTKFGDLSLTFEGISAAFIGNTPDGRFSQSATVSIDGGLPSNISYGDPIPPSYVQWYQTPTLDEREHTISIGGLGGTSLDMVLVTVGPNMSLAGKTLLVDNEDTQIVYNGKWKKNSDRFNAGSLPDGSPIHNSTHQSSTVGDTATFRFTGSSISVYGVFSWMNIGSLTASYSLDGDTSSQTYPVTAATPNYIKNDGEASNFLFYSMSNLSPSTHTLTITVTEARNVAYRLDYITYVPSFANLASMPNLPPLSATSSGIGSSSTSNSTSPHLPSSKLTNVPVGPIVGGVLGGVIVVLLAIIFLWLRRRKQLRELGRNESESAHPPRPESSRGVTYPFNPSMEQVTIHRLSHPTLQSSGPASGDPRTISPYTHRNSSHSRSSFTNPKGSRVEPILHAQDAFGAYETASPSTFFPVRNHPATVSPYLLPGGSNLRPTLAETKILPVEPGADRFTTRQQRSHNLSSSSVPSTSSLDASQLNQSQNPPAYDAISLYREHDTDGRTS